MDDLEDQVGALQKKVDSLESKMDGLVALNERMASDLTQVLKSVQSSTARV